MRRPYHQPEKVGRRHAKWAHGWGVVYRVTRWSGFHLLACGEVARQAGDWVFRLLNNEGYRVKRIDRSSLVGSKRPAHAELGAGLSKLTAVREALTDSAYDDGVPREAPVLILQPRNGVWSLLVKEPGLGLLLRVESKTLDTLWATLEAHLTTAAVPWEIDPRATTTAPKKTRKGG